MIDTVLAVAFAIGFPLVTAPIYARRRPALQAGDWSVKRREYAGLSTGYKESSSRHQQYYDEADNSSLHRVHLYGTRSPTFSSLRTSASKNTRNSKKSL